MIHIAQYSINTVFSAMETTTGKATLPDGHQFKKASPRLVLFKTKGTSCVTCGLEGKLFILETQSHKITPHLNLYGENEKGQLVLMTKDHIIPRSKGGANAQENYNPMCITCNGKKADIYECV